MTNNLIDNPDVFINNIVDRLQEYVTTTLCRKISKYDDVLKVKYVHKDSTNVDEYSLNVNLATLEKDGDIYYDITDSRYPVSKTDVESYLKHKIYLKSLIVARLSKDGSFLKYNKYIRLQDKKLFYFIDVAVNERTGKKWCILKEAKGSDCTNGDQEQDNLILITVDGLEKDYTLIPD